MKNRKRLSIWAHDKSVMVEDGENTRFYAHPTPSSYARIEKLSWHSHRLNLVTTLFTSDDGISFVAIDRE
jgi:hypothetical protein